MKIGVPKEIKPQENRIGLTPESVKTLVSEGHEVLVENNGGFEAGFDNDQYTKAWILGEYDKEQYFKDAKFLKKGQIDGDNGFRVKADCYNMPINKLRMPT